jgi:hypothetical protein
MMAKLWGGGPTPGSSTVPAFGYLGDESGTDAPGIGNTLAYRAAHLAKLASGGVPAYVYLDFPAVRPDLSDTLPYSDSFERRTAP